MATINVKRENKDVPTSHVSVLVQDLSLPLEMTVEKKLDIAEGGGDIDVTPPVDVDVACQLCGIIKQSGHELQLVKMPSCSHFLCKECFMHHFEWTYESNPRFALRTNQEQFGRIVCPTCGLPDLSILELGSIAATQYFYDLFNLLPLNGFQPRYRYGYPRYSNLFVYSKFCKVCINCRRASNWELEESQTRIRCLECADFAYSRSFIKILDEKGLCSTVPAKLVFQLRQMEFSMEDAIYCAQQKCTSVDEALSYLKPQECQICTRDVETRDMVSMLSCVHSCCRDCAKKHFTSKITEANIVDLVCPYCHEPKHFDESGGDDGVLSHSEYLSNMDIMLKSLVDRDVHELFHRKLRDRTLMNITNFHWCTKCGSGFIIEGHERIIICPECLERSCSRCHAKWELTHESVTCEQFASLTLVKKEKVEVAGLNNYLANNGIACPKCHYKFELSKGGCMHFTCTQCRHEFCIGCDNPFKTGGECKEFANCEKSGKHAHHPRNCQYYVRDMEVKDLKKLLKNSGVKFDESHSGNATVTELKCGTIVDDETHTGKVVGRKCGGLVENVQAGLCKLHYVEYLAALIRKHNVDTVTIMTVSGLENELTKHGLKVVAQLPTESPDEYRDSLIKAIQLKLPIGKM